MKKLLFFIVVFVTYSYATDFVLNTGGLLDKRAYQKINEIGNEVKNKIGINVYLDVKGNNGIKLTLPRKERIKQMKILENKLISHLKKPYVVLTLALDQQYANILYSKDLSSVIDKDDILDGYVIPLLAAKDKNTLSSKVSAAVLNGYAQIGDVLADTKHIKLKSSIGSQGKIAGTIWKMFMYTLVLFGIGAYVIVILRERKMKNGN